VTGEALANGLLYPPLTSIRDVSLRIAIAVADVAFESGLADVAMPRDVEEFVREHIYEPVYSDYVDPLG
jgi:malate dehydrogenase (oxaloacetate-decarboxylating)(NADP+)